MIVLMELLAWTPRGHSHVLVKVVGLVHYVIKVSAVVVLMEVLAWTSRDHSHVLVQVVGLVHYVIKVRS